MSETIECDLLVVGAGWRGAHAALRAAADGREVVVSDEGNGRSALWSGLLDVFGPTTAPNPAQLQNRFQRGATPRHSRAVLDPAERLAMLQAVEAEHEYAALDWDAARIRSEFEAAMKLLGVPGKLHASPVLVATSAGTVRYADFVCEGIRTLDDADAFVGLEEFPQWSPEWAARTAAAASGREFAVRWAAHDGPLATSALRVAAAWNSPDERRFGNLAEAARGVRAAVAPVLGTTFEARHAAGELLSGAGVEVGEIAGAADSPFGLRLCAHLRARIDATAKRVGAVASLPKRDGQRWLVDAAGTRVVADELVCEFDALTPPSWAEPWLCPQPRFPRLGAPSPWQAQPFQRWAVEIPAC